MKKLDPKKSMILSRERFVTYIRYISILATLLIGLAAITGSSDDSSSGNYETLQVSLSFDTIPVSYDGTQPETVACTDSTTISAEAREAAPEETRDIRIVTWAIQALDVKYEDAVWDSFNPLETIVCGSSIDGSKGGGEIDVTTIELGSSDWVPADESVAFVNYLNSPNAEFILCVLCRDTNLYSSYQLDYSIKMDLVLNVDYDEPGP